jgi:hypothetical protein
MTASEEILTIANKIANTGKQPSVALVKGRLTQKVSLPIIISTLKAWQHEPEYITAPAISTENKTSKKGEKENIEALITIALAPIKQELADIKRQLAILLKNDKPS